MKLLLAAATIISSCSAAPPPDLGGAAWGSDTFFPDPGEAPVEPVERALLVVNPEGDSLSINHGATGDNGWRRVVFENAAAVGYPVQSLGITRSGDFTENRHSGVSGCSISCLAEHNLAYYGEGNRFHGMPDVVMILTGSADALAGADPHVSALAYKKLCDDLLRAEPGIRALVVATIPPLPDDPPVVEAYNLELEPVWDDLVAEHVGVDFVRVDLFGAMGRAYDQALYGPKRNIHPNDAGYARMGAEYWRQVGPEFDKLTRVIP